LIMLRALILVATFYGTIRTAELAWMLGDIGVGMMAWLNVIAILLLRKPAMDALKDYMDQRKKGLDPQFNSDSLKIKNTGEWDNI
jgi:alanine or glycine:cation symporter, AGCS family